MTKQQYEEFEALCDESRKVSKEICRIIRLSAGIGNKAEVLPALFAQHAELHEKTKPYIRLALEEMETQP